VSARRWFAISGVAFAVLIAAAGGVVALSLHQWMDPAHRHTSTQHHGGVSRLTVDSGSGDVTISAAPQGTTTVAVTRHLSWNRVAPEVSEKQHGHTLAVSASCPTESHVGFDTCRVSLTIKVPADTSVSAHTDSGDTTVRDLSGAVRLYDGSGNVMMTNLSGPVEVQADSGDVFGTELHSTRVRTADDSGDTTLTFDGVPDSVAVTASSGRVDVSVPRSAEYAVQGKADSGSKDIHVPDRAGAPHRINLSTSSGDVVLGYTD
jgi:putative adhesin